MHTSHSSAPESRASVAVEAPSSPVEETEPVGILTRGEAAAVAQLYSVLRDAEHRIATVSYDHAADLADIRAAARCAEAVERVRDALSHLHTIAHVYGECQVTDEAWKAVN